MSDKKTILVIDDETDMVEMLVGTLTSEGYHVIKAFNGLEGLQKIKTVRPHLIILDMNMPKMGGAAFYNELSGGSGQATKIPVLVLTARANLEELFKRLKVDGFMSKPYDLDKLLQEIKRIMVKRYGETETDPTAKKETTERRVLVVEDDQIVYDKITIAFLNAGFVVSAAKSGFEAIERATKEPPDLMLIKLGLTDLSGDIVAAKLKQMPKTMDIPVVVYTPENKMLDYSVTNQLCKKIGIKELVESTDPYVLLKECGGVEV